MLTELINFTKPTGDPFADVGGLVIEYLQEKKPEKSIMELIEEATDIYVKKWNNNLHSFFLNSSITHNSNKGQKGIDKTIAFYQGLLDGENAEYGFCRITGQQGEVFNGARDNHIMSGSSTLINFHHGFESGIRLSKEALIRIFFVPLGVEQLGNKVAVLTSNNEDVTRFFVRATMDNNSRDIGSGISESIQNSDFSNPTNALFDYALQCINNVRTATLDEDTGMSNTAGITLNLFHFTNFGASPTINLFTLPATVFKFYSFCILKHKKDWQNFVFRFYSSSKFKNAQFDIDSKTWTNNKETVEYKDYRIWRNSIFENLLNDKSILYAFLRHSKKYQLNFNIVETYQVNIRNMNKKALTKIKELANFIVTNRSDDEIKKSITRLNGSKYSQDLRKFLLKLVKQDHEEENPQLLISLDEYVEYLFPDGTNWKEIRDLLLIAIYQKLHEVNKKIATEDIEENESENQSNEE
ncbi:type I-B CRISPR-associated protein Cas8b1/Cst1 [Emticicia oligotrophica]|uniref:type I-B CRISPR-associated protein Cas8b1/Cst1 n=1 Tax=Emticicia oligotrophica TaxID=312279 RepID=UPI00273B4235|nr:type I-B CRISPR-associated protein Cas8b1/Cst1 [Emticicia oligotrophica]